jgi:hypothetical protein
MSYHDLKQPVSVRAVDLRYVRQFTISESWDGHSECADGDTSTVILYGTTAVYHVDETRVESSVEHRAKHGKLFWPLAVSMSKTYFEILKIARTKYFQHAHLLTEDWDTVYASKELLAELAEHFQYKEANESFDLSLTEVSQHKWRVDVAKVKSRAA